VSLLPQIGVGGEASRLLRRSSLNFAGMTAAVGLQLVIVAALSRSMSPADVGVLFEGIAVVKIFTVLAALGLDMAAARTLAARQSVRDNLRAGCELRFCLATGAALSVVGAIVVFAGASVAWQEFGGPDVRFVGRLMALCIPPAVLQSIIVGAARGSGDMRPYALVDQFGEWALRLGCIGAVLLAGGGLHGVVIAYVISGYLSCILALYVSLRSMQLPVFTGGIRTANGSRILRFAIPQCGAEFATVGLLWADSLLIGLWRSPADVAIYAVATRTALLALAFITPVAIAFQPSIGQLYAARKWGQSRAVYSYATQLSTIVGVPPLLFLMIFADVLLSLVYGASYAAGAGALIALALGQVVNAVTGPSGYVATMAGRSGLMLWTMMVAFVLNIGLNVVLIPTLGILGAGIAWGAAIAVANGLRLVYANRILGAGPYAGWQGQAALALLGFSAVAVVGRFVLGQAPQALGVAIVGLLAFAAYGACLVGMHAVQSRGRLEERVVVPDRRIA
jgi:O-antigen/teichoic acid export membrane protein